MLANEEESEYILHLELQHSNHKNMALRMLRYYTDIALSHPGKEIKQYVIYTGGSKLAMDSHIKTTGIDYTYTLLDMSQLDCERFIAEDSPDALVLAILCNFKEADSQRVIEKIITRLIELTHQQPDELKRYLKMMEMLSASRKVTQAFKRVETKMLSEINIENLPSYQIGIEKGMDKGIKQSSLKMAKNCIQQGLDDTMIEAITSLTQVEIVALRAKLLK